MKMIVAIVRDEFAAPLTETLSRKGFGATKLASTGGFLKAGNTTFLIGVPQTQMDEAMAVIREACPGLPGTPGKPQGPGVQVGSATIFVLGVDKMIKV